MADHDVRSCRHRKEDGNDTTYCDDRRHHLQPRGLWTRRRSGPDNGATNNGVQNNGEANNGANNGEANNGANNGEANNGGTNNGATNNGATNNGTAANNGETNAGCGSDHPSVGQTLTFSTRAHGVSGDAEILDNGTIEITSFNYDGRGLDVRVYGGIGGNYRDGFPISEDLIRATAYSNESLTLTLPDDRSLDDLDGLSIWCVDVSSSFGDGTFE